MRRAVSAAVLACLALTAAAPARAITPDHPEVKEMIGKAKEYLKTHSDRRAGGKALIATVFAKSGEDASHPIVREAIESCKAFASSPMGGGEEEIYSLGMCLIFLLSLDEQQIEINRPAIEGLHKKLLERQKPHGGWGYHDKQNGDTSMTQYAALGLWEASVIGIEAPVEVWEKMTDWLLRTQAPGGYFGYQANDPGSYDLVEQTAPTLQSMAAAGMGALYICVDQLRLRGAVGGPDPDEEAEGPFKRVAEPADKKGAAPGAGKVNLRQLQKALANGNRWLKGHQNIEDRNFYYYATYAIERYQSFYQPTAKLEASWYNEGVKFLKERQKEDGSWDCKIPIIGAPCDTAFAALFLLRSARKSILKKEAYGAGTLIAGRDLNAIGKGAIELKNGQVRAKPLDGPAEEMFAAIDDPGNANYAAALAALEELKIAPNDPRLERNKARLRKLAAGADPEARLAAVAALGKGRQLDEVPMLIYALSDPDPRVVLEARKALEFVSRKLRGLGPADENSKADVSAAIKRWKQWYLSLRPDAEFIN